MKILKYFETKIVISARILLLVTASVIKASNNTDINYEENDISAIVCEIEEAMLDLKDMHDKNLDTINFCIISKTFIIINKAFFAILINQFYQNFANSKILIFL